MGTLTKEAKQARAAYMREYRANMTEEQKERRREYYRKWREANPDKVKANTIRYWNRQGAKLKQANGED